LNYYRNWPFHLSNSLKRKYEEEMIEQIKKLPKFNKINITMQLFKGSYRVSDKDNVICVTKKFFLDALVKHGKLEDDNDNFVKFELSKPTEYDKENPRVEITIEDYESIDVDAQHYLF